MPKKNGYLGDTPSIKHVEGWEGLSVTRGASYFNARGTVLVLGLLTMVVAIVGTVAYFLIG